MSIAIAYIEIFLKSIQLQIMFSKLNCQYPIYNQNCSQQT